MSGYTKPAQAFSISDVIFFNWDLLVVDWDSWFYTRWIPGLTITIHNKITQYTCTFPSPTFPLKSNTTHPFCCTILLLNSLKIYKYALSWQSQRTFVYHCKLQRYFCFYPACYIVSSICLPFSYWFPYTKGQYNLSNSSSLAPMEKNSLFSLNSTRFIQTPID